MAGQVPARCGQLVELSLKNDRHESALVLSRLCAYCVPVSYPLPLLFKPNKGIKAGFVSSHGVKQGLVGQTWPTDRGTSEKQFER